jgi:hypothetical protein
MTYDSNLHSLSQLESERNILDNRIRSAQLELRVATASGKQEQASRLEADLAGLNTVRAEIQAQIDAIQADEDAVQNAASEAHTDVIRKHEELEAQYRRTYWKCSGWGLALIVVAVFLFAIPFIALPVGAAGVYYMVKGLSQWPKVQTQELLIPFLKAGLSEEDAMQELAHIRQDVKVRLEKEQRDREALATEIAKKMKGG